MLKDEVSVRLEELDIVLHFKRRTQSPLVYRLGPFDLLLLDFIITVLLPLLFCILTFHFLLKFRSLIGLFLRVSNHFSDVSDKLGFVSFAVIRNYFN